MFLEGLYGCIFISSIVLVCSHSCLVVHIGISFVSCLIVLFKNKKKRNKTPHTLHTVQETNTRPSHPTYSQYKTPHILHRVQETNTPSSHPTYSTCGMYHSCAQHTLLCACACKAKQQGQSKSKQHKNTQ